MASNTPRDNYLLPEAEWLDSERWAWEQFRTVGIADFEARFGKLDASDIAQWNADREIRARFVAAVLLLEPYRSTTLPHGVHIIGAWLKEPLTLSSARLSQPLRVERSRFERCLSLRGLRSTDDISFSGSTFCAEVVMEGTRVEGDLDLSDANFAESLDLRRSVVQDQLSLVNARCAGVSIEGARIGGRLDVRKVQCSAALNMNGARIDGALFAQDGSKLVNADLKRAVIGGHADCTGLQCSGLLDMEGIEVSSDVFLARADIREVALPGAKVGGQLSQGIEVQPIYTLTSAKYDFTERSHQSLRANSAVGDRWGRSRSCSGG